MAESDDRVYLGFVEEVESWELLSHFFPSKIGGKPAWLALDNLPSSDKLKCGHCGEPCVFLMQLYANKMDLNPSAFHRTLFVFICRNPKCCETNRNDNLVVVRSQLARKNKFYPYSPAKEDDFDERSSGYPRASDYQQLCNVCDCPRQIECDKCKTSYCSKSHQAADWKAGHKQCCGNESPGVPYDCGILFKEYGLETGAEDNEEEEEEDSAVQEDEVDENMEYEKVAETVNDAGLSTEELQQMANDTEDKKFLEFKEIMDKDPEQVVRYKWAGQPTWVTDSHIPREDEIPPCEYCHSSRVFEFQVMPTLIHHVVVDSLDTSIDWGTLVVYSCSKSCDNGGNYGREFIWKQDFTN